MKKFKLENVNCQNCINLIKNSLQDEFGDICIDLQTKILSIDIKNEDVLKFKNEILELGFGIEDI